MVRGYLVNEFDEKVGCYDINHKNEYYVSMYHESRGYMTEDQLREYAYGLDLQLEESKKVLNKVGKPYGEY